MRTAHINRAAVKNIVRTNYSILAKRFTLLIIIKEKTTSDYMYSNYALALQQKPAEADMVGWILKDK